MNDKTLVERLDILIKDDHERGCQGRYCSCTCGYDNDCSQALQDAKSHIEALEAALRIAAKAERDRIVAWLRDKADDYKPFGTTQGDPTGCVLSLAACAIEESQP